MATNEPKSFPSPPHQLPGPDPGDPHKGDPVMIRWLRGDQELTAVMADDPHEAAIEVALMTLGKREIRIGDVITVSRL